MRIVQRLAAERDAGDTGVPQEIVDSREESMFIRHAAQRKVGHIPRSSAKSGTTPIIPTDAEMWDATHMVEGRSTLQLFVSSLLNLLPERRDWYDRRYQELTGTTGKPLYDIERGKSKSPSRSTLRYLAEITDQPLELFIRAQDGDEVEPIPVGSNNERQEPRRPGLSGAGAQSSRAEDSDVNMVGIQNIDLAWGLGATFTDGAVAVEVLQFPKVWVEAISSAPPALLTWARARGDSMRPTIDDGDLVLLDRSQRSVKEQDVLWAFTVGDTASIKRLRVKGDRYQILSDNPSVPPDEEPIDFVNIVARVIFIGRRT